MHVKKEKKSLERKERSRCNLVNNFITQGKGN